MSLSLCNAIAHEHNSRYLATCEQMTVGLKRHSREATEIRYEIFKHFEDTQPPESDFFSCGEGVATWLEESLGMCVPKDGLCGDAKSSLEGRVKSCISMSIQPKDRLADKLLETSALQGRVIHGGNPRVLQDLLSFLERNEVVYIC